MQQLHMLESIRLERPSLVTIGVFDGVHRGHQFLISQLVQQAHAAGQAAVVVTLFPHPDVVLHGLMGRYYLTTPEQQAELIGVLGVDYVVIQPFNDETRQIRATVFVDRLLTHLHMAGLWITHDFALGYEREGDFAFLQGQGAEKGFTVQEAPLLTSSNGQTIRSSAIRASLSEGNVSRAADWLGRYYALTGPVVRGDGRGRQLGFPTANTAVWSEQILPANGIYACYAQLGTERFRAMTSIGTRPTFDGIDTRVEAYLLDFDRDIYGQTLSIDFVARLRDELKFSSVEALIAQMHQDTALGKEILAERERVG